MKRMGAMAVSPDGRWIVMSVSEPAYDDAQKGSDLWIVPSDGSAPPRRLTSGKAAEGSPVFSPDSRRIAFVAKREGDDVSQIYVLELAGGEAQRVTNWATGARSPLFSPDGRTMLFVSETFPGARTDEDNRKAVAERKARKYVARAYDSFPIRHWDRWLDELRPTLVVQSLDTVAPARDLLAGTALRQGRGYGGRLGNENDALDAAWTPDGRGVVFAATTNRNEAARAEVYASLWQVSLDGGEPRRLTADQGDYSSPKFTDDGRTLLAKVQPRSEQHVYVADRLARWTWPSLGDARVLTAGFDEQVADFEPAPDSARAFFLAEHHGHQRLYQVALKSGAVSEVGQLDAGSYAELAVGGPSSSPVVATVWASAAIPHEAGRVNLASGRWSALTSFNSAQAAALALPPVEEFWFTSSRGKRIHNFVVRPPGFDAQKKYPLFVVMHGGPHIDVARRLRAALELPPARAAGLRGAADELQWFDGIRRGLRAEHPGRPARGAGEGNQRGGGRGDPSLRIRRRLAPGCGRGKLRRPPRELARREHGPVQGDREPCGPLRPQDAMDHERRRLFP